MKAAILVAISGVMLCPFTLHADECMPGRSMMLVESSKPDYENSTTDFVVRLESKAPVSLEQLKNDHVLQTIELEVGYWETYWGSPPSVRFELEETRNEPDGSLCLVFQNFAPGSHSNYDLNNVSSVNGGAPVVCVSKAGVVTSTLEVDVGPMLRAPDDRTAPRIFVVAEVTKRDRTRVTLVSASPAACK